VTIESATATETAAGAVIGARNVLVSLMEIGVGAATETIGGGTAVVLDPVKELTPKKSAIGADHAATRATVATVVTVATAHSVVEVEVEDAEEPVEMAATTTAAEAEPALALPAVTVAATTSTASAIAIGLPESAVALPA